MDLKIIDRIVKELDKLDCKEYSLQIQLRDNTEFTIQRLEPKKDKQDIGFSK